MNKPSCVCVVLSLPPSAFKDLEEMPEYLQKVFDLKGLKGNTPVCLPVGACKRVEFAAEWTDKEKQSI